MRISISHIFYNQHQMLPLHWSAWTAHPSGAIEYNLIDDASPTPIYRELTPNNLKVFRVNNDIPWNIAGARNLAFHVSTSEWVLCADIDHIVTAHALQDILELNFDNPNVAYTFMRRRGDGFIGG